MRILLISSYFYPHQGGSQRYMEELYQNLMKIDPAIEVDVVCYNSDKAQMVEKYRRFTIYRVPCVQILPGQFALPNYFNLIWILIKLSQKHTYDIVHSNTRFFDHSWWTPLLAKLLGAKSVMTDHCASFPVHPSRLLTTVIKFVDKLTTLTTSRFYDLIMVTNKSTKQFVQSIGMNNPLILYGGVDSELFNSKRREKIRSIPKVNKRFSDEEIVVTFLGRMIKTKGPQILMEVARHCFKKYPKVKFVFAGNGEMYNKLNQRIHPNNILFTGSLDKKDVATLLANTDIFIHPSIHHEGFPNAILEAGASGCAVIATDMGGTRELIIDGITGLLIKPSVRSLYKSLIYLIRNIEIRKKLADNLNKKILKEFDWKNIASEYKKVIDKNLISSNHSIFLSYKTKTI